MVHGPVLSGSDGAPASFESLASIISGMVPVMALACGLMGCGGSDPTPAGPTVLELGFHWTPGTTACLAPTSIHLHFLVQGANAGDHFVVTMTGPDVPRLHS